MSSGYIFFKTRRLPVVEKIPETEKVFKPTAKNKASRNTRLALFYHFRPRK